MKKKNLIGVLLCTACLTAGGLAPAAVVSADSMRVVTLGADLTEEQKNTMLRYFKVSADEVELMYITNKDEREHLSDYVPIEQIGTRTVSCAYVRPTESGGIKVRTANLNWVTGNMIASTLSTSGVKNCEVIAACPFEVSGTGALTGIQMAYETASGEKLDEKKKEIATAEMVVTGKLADEVGKNDATSVINEAKMEVIQNNVQNADEIYNIVNNIAQQNNINIDADQLQQIVDLLKQIAEQGYVFEDMQETLERVEENVTGETTETDDMQETQEPTDEDSIMNDVDESVLGDDVKASSTEDPTLEQETGAVDNLEEVDDPFAETPSEEETDETEEFEQFGEEDVTEVPEENGENSSAATEEPGVSEETEGTESTDTPDTSLLSEQAKSMYDKLEDFCLGEYEGDSVALQGVMGEDAVPSVTLDTETGKKLTARMQEIYFGILNGGTASYVPSETDTYMNAELNMMHAELKKLFGIDGAVQEEGEDILVDISQEDKQLLYDDAVKFFEKLYGEETFTGESATTETEVPADASGTAEEDSVAEELPQEDTYTEDTGIPEAQEEYVEY